jgi:hypothetical protein
MEKFYKYLLVLIFIGLPIGILLSGLFVIILETQYIPNEIILGILTVMLISGILIGIVRSMV